MSRYKVEFKPQGVIPQDIKLGVRLNDKGTPSEGCCDSCDGWAVLEDDAPVTGDVILFGDQAVTFDVTLLGELCPDVCIEWDLRQLSEESDPAILADFTVTPVGCDGVNIVGAGSLSYANVWLGLYPTIDGKPFCQPIIFRQYIPCVSELTFVIDAARGTDSGTDGSKYGSAGQIQQSGNTGITPAIENLPPLCPNDLVTWNITQTAGITGNGEAISTGVALQDWNFIFTTIVDLTNSSFDVFPNVNGVDHPEFTMTFMWDAIEDIPIP